MKENTKNGFHNGGIAPYGYKLSKVIEPSGATKTILVPGSEEEVNTIKKIFNLYIYEGYGYKKVANLLNEEGILSSTGNKWSYTSIQSILHNEAYIGNSIWNMNDYSTGKKKKPESEWIRKEGTHLALISPDVFKMVKEKSKSRIKNSKLFGATNTSFVLRGMLRCPFCGSNMVSRQSGGKSRTLRRYYVCGLYQRKGKSTCKFKSFNRKKSKQKLSNA
jgi:predicted RNA-binding Zn-ribbon protein involved in translation (DUF1610 family)